MIEEIDVVVMGLRADFLSAQVHKAQKQLQNLRDFKMSLLRKLKQYSGDCPVCGDPMVSFGSYDYDWNAHSLAKGFDECLISGSDKRYHSKCFYSRFGHID